MIFIFALLFLGLPLSTPGYDTRLLALNSPTLSQTAGADAAFGAGNAIIFPTDEFGLGLSSVPDTFDIWKLPGRLADKELFPSNSVILDYTGAATGNGGIVIAPAKLPFTLGVFALRPSQNGWVIGSPRGDLGLSATYYDEAVADGIVTVPGTQPAAPTNIIDALIAAKLGRFTIGGGVGYAYDKALDSATSTEGTADSEITQKAESSVFTVRVGAGMDLTLGIPIAFDLGMMYLFSNHEATYKSGAAAVPASEDDSVNADNESVNFCVRAFGSVSPTIDIVLLGDFVIFMDQEYTQKDNGTALDSNTAQVHEVGFSSYGFGAGINWTPSEKVLVNALVTAVLGQGGWIAETPPAGAPEDSLTWKTFRGVIDGEFTITHWMLLRGGLGCDLSWSVTDINVATGGTASEVKSFMFTPSAAAGMGIKIKDPVTLDFVVNTSNLASSNWFQTLALQTSIKVDF
jgi:hypothetical protein